MGYFKSKIDIKSNFNYLRQVENTRYIACKNQNENDKEMIFEKGDIFQFTQTVAWIKPDLLTYLIIY